MSPILSFVIGLIIITVGSELLLKGASKIAAFLGVQPIIIGLTVVSIGTSLPELAVGVSAIKEGASDMAIGNIAGTNLVNLLLILGLTAAIKPLPLRLNSIKTEVFVMIFAAVLLFILCLDGNLGYIDAIILLSVGLTYVIYIIRKSKTESSKIRQEYAEEYEIKPTEKQGPIKWVSYSLILILGISGTIYGADLLILGAVEIAETLGMSDAVIGLTILAIGTSAPELATTLVATYKDDRDVAIGNLIGSSISNILLILSTTTLFTSNGLKVDEGVLWFDLPLAALVAIVCYPVFKSDQTMSRKEGIAFVSLYV